VLPRETRRSRDFAAFQFSDSSSWSTGGIVRLSASESSWLCDLRWRNRFRGRYDPDEGDEVRRCGFAAALSDHLRDLPAVIRTVQADMQKDVLHLRSERLAGAVTVLDFPFDCGLVSGP
jgi:hypothetical protein